MATENPVRMLSSGGGMRAGIGGRVGLGDGLRGGASILGGGGGGGAHHHHHHSSSLMTQEGEAELGLLLNRRTRLELSEKKKGVVVPPQRSGSAPPSVEGSFAAMGGLFSYLSKNPKSGSGGALGVSKAQSGEGGGDFVVLDAEQQQRSDPAYLIYYYNNINLNPRLPPPLISWENYRLAQRLQSGLGAPHPKSLVDLIQEDFPWTPSPVYQLSRSSSRAANEESGDANPTLDMQLTHLQDVLPTSATPAELNAIVAAGLGSHSLTPIPGVASIHGQSSGLAAPVPRTASLDFPVSCSTQSASPGLATIGSVSGRSGGTMNLTSAEARSVALNRAASGSTAEFVSAFHGSMASSGSVVDLTASLQGMSMSVLQEATAAMEDQELLQLQQEQEQELHLQQHHQQQQQQQCVQIAAQAQAAQAVQLQALAYNQALQQQQQQQQQQQRLYSGIDSGYRGQVEFSVPGLTSQQAQAAALQPALHAGATTSNMYVAATAAMNMAGNPFYPTLNSTAVYASHYGISGYPVNPAVLTPIMAGYPPPVAFDAAIAAAVAASMGVQAGVPGSPAQGAVDMQHLYKFAEQAGSGFSPQLHDPIYLLQYMQHATDEAHTLNDPGLFRIYSMGGGHMDLMELQKSQLGAMLGYTGEQKSQYARTGPIGVPIASNKSGSVSPAY
ncbi:unnamed protein product [Sphagnum jensenii]|uniref:Nucleic acid binding NABP domain-containing protein n=1 Tax=Sphagnum jensenii TaxID=128206 RepID=A0ABP1C260_9BRYO